MAALAEQNLLFGLLALQNGLIDQVQLVAAFQAWTRDRVRPLAQFLLDRGDIDVSDRAAVDVLVARNLKKHGGSAVKSIASIPASDATRNHLVKIRSGDDEIDATLAHIGSAATADDGSAVDPDGTANFSFGAATGDGQRFRLLRAHARGGLGEVFVALDTELHREVALKQILDAHADDQSSRQRFVREAEITGGLEHPGIVPVYGLGTYAGGRPYYAMRFVRGDSFKEAIEAFHKKSDGPRDLELRKLLLRFLDVCNAIGYAHGRGVLHRDIKPANVILGRHGETLVVDWGLAKAVGKADSDSDAGGARFLPKSSSGSSETLPGSALGTPAFMSPEQAEGELDRLGPRSDVYSLGATLSCLLTGVQPFLGDVMDVLRRVRRGDVSPPRAIDPSIDPALEAVCLKAMALKPDDRYESCLALADDIERRMAGEPVTAWREPIAVRVRRWARRHRTAVTAACAALVVALAGTGAVLAVQTAANASLMAANSELAIASSKLEQSNVHLHAANAQQRQRFELALQAVNLFHGEVSEDFLLKEKQFESLRVRLLRGAATFYGKLEELVRGEADPESRTALGKAYEALARLTAAIGNHAEALTVSRKAVAVRRELAGRPAATSQATLDLVESLLLLANLHTNSSNSAGALGSSDEARARCERVVSSEPLNDFARFELANSENTIADSHYFSGKLSESLAAHTRARAVLQALADGDASKLSYQRELARTEADIGVMLGFTGKPGDAVTAFEHALAIQKKISATDQSAGFRSELARTFHNMGSTLSNLGKLEPALAAYKEALALRRQLAAEMPNFSQFQSGLAGSHGDLGVLLAKMGQPGEAASEFEKSLEICERLVAANPTRTAPRSEMAVTLIDIGSARETAKQAPEAAAAYRRAAAIIEQLPELKTDDQYNVACVHARLAGLVNAPGSGVTPADARAEADRAMSWLKIAISKGYRNIALMRRDPDLAPLRSRADFQLMMMDLAMPANAFGDL